jgi:hypothetical protein
VREREREERDVERRDGAMLNSKVTKWQERRLEDEVRGRQMLLKIVMDMHRAVFESQSPTHLQYAAWSSRAVVHGDRPPCADLFVVHSLPPAHALQEYPECDHHLLVHNLVGGEEGPVSGARRGLPLVIEEVEDTLVFGIHLVVWFGVV